MISNIYCNNRFMALFVLVAATVIVLSISVMLQLQPTNAIQPINQFPQSIASPAKLTFTSVGGDLRGSIEGLLSDLSDMSWFDWRTAFG